MNKTYYLAIIPIIAFCIGVFHKKPDWFQTRSGARSERKEARGYTNGWYRDNRNWLLERGSLSH